MKGWPPALPAEAEELAMAGWPLLLVAVASDLATAGWPLLLTAVESDLATDCCAPCSLRPQPYPPDCAPALAHALLWLPPPQGPP